jgi:hypothetical protein
MIESWTPAMRAKDRILPNPRPGYLEPDEVTLNRFQIICTLEGWWSCYISDFDLLNLISKLGEVVRNSYAGQELARALKILNPLTMSSLINFHDAIVPNGLWW